MLKHICGLAVLLAMVFLVAGCGGGGGQETGFSVLGSVVDYGTQQPVTGALVTIGTGQALTDATGAYQVDNLAEGEATFTVTRDGYQTFMYMITVGPDRVTTLPAVRLIATGGGGGGDGPPPPPWTE